MSQIEQYPVDMNTERTHIPRTRTLVQRTHSALMAGEVLSPDMYVDIFPGHNSMADGFEATYEDLQAWYAEAQCPDVSTERLIELFHATNLTGQYVLGPFAATTGGSYVLEANAILGQDEQLTTADIETSEAYAEIIYPPELAAKAHAGELHPKEYYHVIGNFALQHVRAFDDEHIPPSIFAMRAACRSLSYLRLAGHITSTMLDTLQQRLESSDEYYTLRNKLPYKKLIFPSSKTEDQCFLQDAHDAIARFRAGSYGELTVSSDIDITRGGNYESALRVVCGSYLSLRKAGYAQPDAITSLYAHGAVFRDLTKGSTDAYAFRLPASIHASTHDEHLFSELYEDLVDVVENDDGTPHLQFKIMNPYVCAQLSDDVSGSVVSSYARKRQLAGRCPARHLVSGISGDRPDNITRLSADIIKEYGVDPHILSNGHIHPTSLIMAMTIRQSEKYNLFNVLEDRFAEERML